jgi:hypothetical protein
LTQQYLTIERLNDAAALVKHQRYISFLVSLAFFGLLGQVMIAINSYDQAPSTNRAGVAEPKKNGGGGICNRQ